jgi:hypothetical protein
MAETAVSPRASGHAMNTTHRHRFATLALGALALGALALRAAPACAQGHGAPAVYDLAVREAWDGSVPGAQPATPAGEPAAASWRPATRPGYTVQLSADGLTVAIAAGGADPPLHGRLASTRGDVRTYTLDAGTFAGGRFVLTGRGAGLRGELLVYGSGVPIVRGVRGAMVPRP